MLPDGAERQLEDWTIFFLNQTPFNTIAPVLALETPDVNVEDTAKTNGGELLYVLNLVRTKHDKTFRRFVICIRCSTLSNLIQRRIGEGDGHLHSTSVYSDF